MPKDEQEAGKGETE